MKSRHVRSLSIVCALLAWGASPAGAQETLFSSLYAVENGDINGDGGRDVGDAIGLLEWLYLGGPSPVAMACQLEAPAVENGDVTGNGGIDLSDAVGLLGWLFLGGFEPIVSCPLDLAPSGGHGGGDRLRIISPRATYQGRSLGEWSAIWWRWAINLPATGHPFFDPAACGVGQHGPVWFLSGSFGDPQVRECDVPAGKAILFPILNAECSMVEPPPFFGSNEAELRECADGFMDPATGMRAWVDGREVHRLDRFRTQSPLYGVNFPAADNILGVPGPGSTLSVSDGVWVLLAPSEPGEHTIRFKGEFPGLPLDMTYKIHVVPPGNDPRVVPVDRRVAGKTYGDWGAEWWKFVLAIPFDESPVPATSTGCAPDQHGPVHFLFGTFGGSATRNCTIPAGKHVFFPLLNSINDFPCPDPGFAPAAGQSMEDFLTNGIDLIFSNLVTALEADLDGDPLENLFSFRATSRLETFTADLSNQVIDPCITGNPQVGVADGYWVILKPLSRGEHVLHWRGAMDFFGFPFELDVTYNLTVASGHGH